jgi:hypothetical protein
MRRSVQRKNAKIGSQQRCEDRFTDKMRRSIPSECEDWSACISAVTQRSNQLRTQHSDAAGFIPRQRSPNSRGALDPQKRSVAEFDDSLVAR